MANEVSKVESPQAQYLPLVQDAASVRDVIEANVGDGGVTRFDLDKVTVPSGRGGIVWAVPTLEGAPRAETELVGIIVGFRDTRAYWRQGLDESGGNTPPDCASEDSRIGHGKRWDEDKADEPHECKACPMAEFGSNEGHGSQACKQNRNLFLLRPGEMIPLLVQLPPTSLKLARQFMLRLASRNLPHYAVAVRIGLTPATNADGIKYAQAAFAVAAQLDESERAKMKAYVEAFAPILRQVQVDRTPQDGAEPAVDA